MKLKIPVVLLFLLSACALALADDFNPPSYRDAHLSYWAEWDAFDDGDFSGFFPDLGKENAVDDNDPATWFYQGLGTHGLGNTHLDFSADPGWAIVPGGGGIYNPLSNATFVANTANWVDWEAWKLLRVQVTYTDVLANGPPTIMGVTGHEEAYPNGSLPELAEDVLTPGGLVGGAALAGYFYEDWIIIPNPDWEAIYFHLPRGTTVDQIVIDTLSSPEPAGLGLMGVALLALRRRRS